MWNREVPSTPVTRSSWSAIASRRRLDTIERAALRQFLELPVTTARSVAPNVAAFDVRVCRARRTSPASPAATPGPGRLDQRGGVGEELIDQLGHDRSVPAHAVDESLNDPFVEHSWRRPEAPPAAGARSSAATRSSIRIGFTT